MKAEGMNQSTFSNVQQLVKRSWSACHHITIISAKLALIRPVVNFRKIAKRGGIRKKGDPKLGGSIGYGQKTKCVVWLNQPPQD